MSNYSTSSLARRAAVVLLISSFSLFVYFTQQTWRSRNTGITLLRRSKLDQHRREDGALYYAVPVFSRVDTPTATERPSPMELLERYAIRESAVLSAGRAGPQGTARGACTPTAYASNLTLLGKRLERCIPTSRSGGVDDSPATVVFPEDIYVTIKTTQKNHVTRIYPLLLTWLQTIQPDQVHIVTDKLLPDEELFKISNEIGFHVIEAGCGRSHVRDALCCKSGAQYSEYFSAVSRRPSSIKPYKWYCQFDDDVYVNIPVLIKALRELNVAKFNSNDFYFGRWPDDAIVNPRITNGHSINQKRLAKLGISIDKPRVTFKWATGASYCISSSLMLKMEVHLRRHSYQEYCSKLDINDDLVPGLLAAVERCLLHDDRRVKNHYDQLGDIPHSELKNQVTISYSIEDNNTIRLSNPLLSPLEDPSRFLAYHCLLYPTVSWCN